ncbi:MAG TPA: hypothetical protein VJ302_02515, partial [Blastocatellia bacterium]|nr:hypothetical protein [Blastocatellia bacterium]
MPRRIDPRLHSRLTGPNLAAGLLLTVFLTCSLPRIANGQTGVSILPPNLYQSAQRVGANATASPIEISGQPFDRGYRIAVIRTSREIDDARLEWRTTAPVKQGDHLQIAFWVRKIAPLNGDNIRGLIGFGAADSPGAGSLLTPFPCDSDVWTKYVIPFQAAADYPAGSAQVVFQFA